jgi:hypothetical protein
LSDLCADLERIAGAGGEGVLALVGRIEAEYARVDAALRAEVDQRRPPAA